MTPELGVGKPESEPWASLTSSTKCASLVLPVVRGEGVSSEPGWLRDGNIVVYLQDTCWDCAAQKAVPGMSLEAWGQSGPCQWCGRGEGGRKPPFPAHCPVPRGSSPTDQPVPCPASPPPPPDKGPKPEARPGTMIKSWGEGEERVGTDSPHPQHSPTPGLAYTCQGLPECPS